MGKCVIRKVHKYLNDVYFAFVWNFIKKRNLHFFFLSNRSRARIHQI